MSGEGRVRLRVVIGVLAVVALAACGGPSTNPLDLPTMTDPSSVALTESSAPASGGATATGGGASSGGSGGSASSGWTTGEVFGKGAKGSLGKLGGSARSHPDLVRAVVDYWDVRVRIGNTWRVDETALQAVASGRGASQARKRATVMQSGERHVVGTFVVNATAVEVSGAKATVTGCMEDWTREVDGHGQTVIDSPGGRVTTLELTRSGPGWRVSDVPHDVPPFCLQKGTKYEIYGSDG